MLFACPTSGSQLLLLFRRVLPFSKGQERSLRPLNDEVAEALRTVINRVVHASGVTPTQCRIAVTAYAGEIDNVVTPASAQSVFPETGVLPGDHNTVIRPRSANDLIFRALRSDVLKALESAYAEPSAIPGRSVRDPVMRGVPARNPIS